MSDIRAVTYESARLVTLSATAPDPLGPFVALQATLGAGLANVVTLRGEGIQVYLPLGVIVPLAVKQVLVSGTTATGIIGFVALPYKTFQS